MRQHMYDVNVSQFDWFVETHGGSSREFASRAGVSKSTVYNIRKDGKVSLETGVAIAEAFNAKFVEVFGQESKWDLMALWERII